MTYLVVGFNALDYRVVLRALRSSPALSFCEPCEAVQPSRSARNEAVQFLYLLDCIRRLTPPRKTFCEGTEAFHSRCPRRMSGTQVFYDFWIPACGEEYVRFSSRFPRRSLRLPSRLRGGPGLL